MKSYLKGFSGTCLIVIIFLTAVILGPALAQEKFPTKPVTLIISWSPGGGQDLAARALQPLVEKELGQSLIIVNKPGGGASIGFNYVANADPDGYTILQLSPSVFTLKYTTKTGIDYKNYEPIIFGTYTPAAILVRPDAPWKTLKEFLDYARANPGKLRVANSGYAGLWHIAALAMEHAAGVKFSHVPYKGTGPSIPAILGGHVDAVVAGPGDTLHLVKGGELKIIGVAAPERCKFVPEAQTFNELGMKVDIVSFYTWVGPKGVPKERVKILYDAFKKALESKEFGEYCDKQGITLSIKGPEEFGKYLEQEDKKFKDLITSAGIKPE
jgi:tripartite-type tricarboxylate transporter receptor subunit TctC